MPINQPSGATESCSYTVEFESPVTHQGGSSQSYSLTISDTAAATVSDSSRSVARSYTAGDTFFATGGISVAFPGIDTSGGDAASSSDSLYANTAFPIQYARSAGPATGCSPGTLMWTVSDQGDVGQDTDNLIDRPSGESDRCEYELTFPEELTSAAGATPAWKIVRTGEGTFDTSVSFADQSAAARYHAVFTPQLRIIVPQYNADDNDPATQVDESAQNAFTGTVIRATVERATGPSSGCSSGNVDWTVAANGSATPDVELVEVPPNRASRCTYTATFATNEQDATDLTRRGATATLDFGFDTVAEVRYDAATSMFMPEVTLSVPFVDGTDADMANEYDGQVITISYEPVASPSQDGNCSTGQTETWTIGAGGSEPAGGVATRTTTATLVDRPSGVEARCTYTASVSGPLTGQGGQTANVVDSDDNQEFTKIGRALTIRYSSSTFFDAAVDITVPDVTDAQGNSIFAGTTIGVTFAHASGGSASTCSPSRTVMFTLDDMGDAVTDEPLDFVHRPQGSMPCVYSVEFGAATPPVGATPAWSLEDQGSGAASASDANKSVARTYASAADFTFVPSIAISVPDVDGLTAGESLFAGASFSVAVMPAANQHASCSTLAQPLSFTVQANDSVTGTDPILVDVPAGQTAGCSYDWTVTAASPTAGATLSWTLTEATKMPATLTASASTATASFTVGLVTFTPEVTIEVPPYNGDDDPNTQMNESMQNAFTGRVIVVDFERSAGPSGCTTVTKRYVIGPTGTVVPEDGSDVVLAHFPDGDTSAACVFHVRYATFVGPVPALEPDLNTIDSSTQASDLPTRVVYESMLTFVAPVTVAVPFVDADADDVNDLATQTVTVSYVPVAGSDDGCPTDRVDVFTVENEADAADATLGVVSSPSAPAQLVDRPLGVVARCAYTADAPDSLTPTGGDAIDIAAGADNQNVTPTGGAITIRYGDVPAPVVQPPVVQPPAPQVPATPTGGGGGTRRPSTGGGGGGGRTGGSSGGGSSDGGSSGAASGPFVPSATERVPIAVSVALPADTFSSPTPVELLVHAPGECGTDVRTFDGLAAMVGIVYALDAASASTAEVIADGARHLAQFAERGTQQRACELRVTLLSAPAGCALDGNTTDDAGRSYVELAWNEGATSLALTPALVCTNPT